MTMTHACGFGYLCGQAVYSFIEMPNLLLLELYDYL